ncbi:hypothetical protein A6A08_06765 [Nocardiopsis sp. TSRI0078]|uniref:hypothetical protein n=1 Tax=unclassified Nocardiopsis TaxID=2649073 RepID=UPI00093AB2E8|nr:hypothetical protein [Nocardiopsis sp. TSRI0078]OKI16968.1 hypothetical protein A6A08_06765 [Nocardiopsis sp. TSRI0078]
MTESIYSAVHACLDWARTIEPRPVLDPDSLLFLLTAHMDAGASGPGDWSAADVHGIARTVRAWERVPEGLRETWLTWCDFLVEQGRLLSAESPRGLRAAIAEVDLTPGGPPPEEPADEAALPILDRLGVGENGRPEAVPPIVPAGPVELDAAAHLCRPLTDAARLAEWVGTGRILGSGGTGEDALLECDAQDAAADLGLPPERVPVLFAVARGSGLLRTTYTKVLPGPAARTWLDGEPGAAADAWADALLTMAEPYGVTVFLLLTDLFVHGRARTPAQLATAYGPGVALGDGAPDGHVHQVLEVLAGLGAVDRLADDRFLVTRLGDHFMVRQLRRSGADIVVTPPVAEMDAARVLDLLEEGRPVDTEGLLERWVAARDTESAVLGLFQATSTPGARYRRRRVARLLTALDGSPAPSPRPYAPHPAEHGAL